MTNLSVFSHSVFSYYYSLKTFINIMISSNPLSKKKKNSSNP